MVCLLFTLAISKGIAIGYFRFFSRKKLVRKIVILEGVVISTAEVLEIQIKLQSFN